MYDIYDVFRRIKDVYSLLQDEESKGLFFARFQYDIDTNPVYLREITGYNAKFFSPEGQVSDMSPDLHRILIEVKKRCESFKENNNDIYIYMGLANGEKNAPIACLITALRSRALSAGTRSGLRTE